MGLATAYVRLGERHAEGRCSPQAQGSPKLPIPFTISKSSRRIPLTTSAVTSVHGLKWMQELSTMCRDAESKLASNGKELARPNLESNGVSGSEKAKLHEGDLYLCSESLDALEGSLGAVCDAVDQVFGDFITKRAFVSIRPPGHHCSADYPSGFCWINNVHVGISHAAQIHGLTHAAIIDFDLHHGDGSQAITWAHNAAALRLPKNAPASKKASIGYFSLHDINSYPCEYGDREKVQNASLCIENAHGQTIWNTHLQPWKNESEFWNLYDTRYCVLIEKARAFLLHHSMKRRESASPIPPKAAIYISAGFDASQWEGSGMQRHKVNVPTEFYARFTRDIVNLADEDGLGVGGRVISILEGGYSDRALSSGVLSHLCGLVSPMKLETVNIKSNGHSHEVATRLGDLENKETIARNCGAMTPSSASYEPSWWSAKCLEELENVEKGPQVPVPVKKQPSGIAPTYTTPTQASTAKAISPLQPKRSMSASTAASLQLSSSSASSRPPTPLSLEVDWATAAQELCMLLIPTNRSITSHRPEELNVQATRVRKDRQSILAPVDEAQTFDNTRMQLRDRKSKASQPTFDEGEASGVTKANRRKTIAHAASLVPKSVEETDVVIPATRALAKAPIRRRSSVASSTILPLEDNSSTMPGALHQSEVPRAGEKFSSGSKGSQLGLQASDNSDQLVPAKHRQTRNIGPIAMRPKKKAVEKPPPVLRASSSSLQRIPKQSAEPSLHEGHGPPSKSLQSPTTSDVDSIVSGIKKISLKLNPPKKSDQEMLLETKKAAARAPRKAVEVKASKDAAGQTAVIEAPALADSITVMPPKAQQAGIPEGTTANTALASATESTRLQLGNAELQSRIPHHPPVVPYSDYTPSFRAPTAPAISATAGGIENSPPFANTSGKEPAMPRISPATNTVAPLTTILNPQVATPKRTRVDLPIFTSTSTITFAPQERGTKSLGELTSQDSEADRVGNVGATGLEGKDMTPSLPMSREDKAEQSLAIREGDIWIVPDSPQRRQ